MIDPFGRSITYLRVSVTDRCDLRCVYCMAEDMTFLPKRELLTLEELDRVCAAFIRLGTNKIRITGGEPLVRRDVMQPVPAASVRAPGRGGLKELVVTTNGTQLAKLADGLYAAGRPPDQRFARHAGSGEIRQHHPLGQDRRRRWTASSPPRLPGWRSRSTPWR